jgi:hypothetical protein
VITIGAHRFTPQDAEGTVALGTVLVDLLTDGLPDDAVDAGTAAAIAGHRAVIAEAGDESDAPLEQRLATVWDAWRAAAAALRASGALGPAAEGHVAHLALSDGGVPKRSADRVEVGWGGVEGDRQVDTRNHGRPWQALCLWSTEVIDAFVATGDPLAPGRAGENVTVTGLPWAQARPGSLLTLGGVTCEVWAYAIPCHKNAQWFADGRFDRMHHSKGPVSRLYAAVVEPGPIAVGDLAVLHPQP